MPMDITQYEEMMNALEKDGAPKQRPFWKPTSKEQGKWTLRLLPPLFKKGEVLPYFRHLIHYVNGKAYECLNQTLTDKNGNKHLAESCPLCDMKEKLFQKGEKDSEEWKLAKDLKARNIFDYRGIVREDENSTIPKIIRMPIKCHDEIIEKLKEKIHGNFFDISKGKDLLFKKKGEGIGSSYSIDLFPEESPVFTRSEDLKQLVSSITELNYSSVIEFSSVQQVQAALNEFLGNTDELVESIDNRSQDYFKKVVETKEIDPFKEINEEKHIERSKKETVENIEEMMNDVFGEQ